MPWHTKKTQDEINERSLRKAYKAKNTNTKTTPKRTRKKEPNYKTMPYHAYLKTKRWQKIRNCVLVRDNHKCIICGNTTCLEVHHDTYKNRGDELNHLSDLMTLCKKCHREHHNAQM